MQFDCISLYSIDTRVVSEVRELIYKKFGKNIFISPPSSHLPLYPNFLYYLPSYDPFLFIFFQQRLFIFRSIILLKGNIVLNDS